jgi:hypothetical protein
MLQFRAGAAFAPCRSGVALAARPAGMIAARGGGHPSPPEVAMPIRAVFALAALAGAAAAQTTSYSGTWSIAPTMQYSCAFGLVQFTVERLQIVDLAPVVQVTLAPSFGAGPLTGTLTGTSLIASRTLPGGCTETYTLVLSFPDPDRCTGTFTAAFVGQCFGCVQQQWTITGSRAGYTTFGAGCAGSLGVAHLAASQLPRLGQTLVVNVDHLPLALAVMITGFSSTQAAFGPLPFGLAVIGMPGCDVRVSLDVTDALVGTGTTASWQLAVPNQPALLGLRFHQQALVFDPPANAFGAVISDAATVTIGL